MSRCLVPPGAGVGSAIGFLRAPFSFEANRSVYTRLSDMDAGKVRDLLRDLQAEATKFVRSCDAAAEIGCEYKVYMRYTGQGWEIPVILSAEDAADPKAGRFQELFEADYTQLFGRPVEGLDIEITVWAVNATTPPQPVTPVADTGRRETVSAPATRDIFDPALGQAARAGIVERKTLETGQGIDGPAAITEAETTIIVPSSRRATRRGDGCIELTEKA